MSISKPPNNMIIFGLVGRLNKNNPSGLKHDYQKNVIGKIIEPEEKVALESPGLPSRS